MKIYLEGGAGRKAAVVVKVGHVEKARMALYFERGDDLMPSMCRAVILAGLEPEGGIGWHLRLRARYGSREMPVYRRRAVLPEKRRPKWRPEGRRRK